MNTTTESVIASTTMAPEIQHALKSIELQEVQDIMKRLADFNLGVCIPHMHCADLDFALLPPDKVQVEEGCRVRWLDRSDLAALPNSVSVAWRWMTNGVHSAAECIKTCSWNAEKGSHYTDHL